MLGKATLEEFLEDEKFGDFLGSHVLNVTQQEFVKAIIDYVRENGDIQRADLIEKSPFDAYDMMSLFGQNITFITYLVDTIHGRIMAAQRGRKTL